MNSTQDARRDEVDLTGTVLILWRARYMLFGALAAGLIASSVWAFLRPDLYTSQTVLAAAESDSSSLGGMLGQYGAIAGLAGIDLGASGGDNARALGLEVLRSRKFVLEFIERHELLVPLLAASYWDEDAEVLVIDDGIFDTEAGVWRDLIDPPKRRKPTDEDAYEAFMELLSVSEDPETGFVTASLTHVGPQQARDWLAWLVEDLNETLRAADIDEAQRSIEFLQAQVQQTPLTDMRARFFDLIQEQTEKLMLTEARKDYVFDVVDPPFLPVEASGPPRLLHVLLLTILTGLVASVITLGAGFRNIWFGEGEPLGREDGV